MLRDTADHHHHQFPTRIDFRIQELGNGKAEEFYILKDLIKNTLRVSYKIFYN